MPDGNPQVRRLFDPKPGDTVLVHGTKVRFVGISNGQARIVDAVGEESAVAQSIVHPLPREQRPLPNSAEVTHEQWEWLNKVIEVLRPILREKQRLTEGRVKKAKAALGVSRASVFRMVERFSGNWLDFLARAPHPSKDSKKLSALKERAIQDAIDQLWRNNHNRDKKAVWELAGRLYVKAGGDSVYDISYSTVVRRINACDAELRLLKNNTDEQARKKGIILGPGREKLPGILSHVEIDTWSIDKIFRSRTDRADIVPRLFLTTALDSFSHSVLSFNIDESENYHSVALCIIKAVFPKDAWLEALGLCDLEYIQHGMFYDGVLTDAGRAHDNRWFLNNLKGWGMNMPARRLGRPEDSPNGEGWYNFLRRRVEQLPGALFNSPQRRGDYDSEAHSIFTEDGFEKWLMAEIFKYHNEPQESLEGYTPNQRWMQSLEGKHGLIPVGKPPMPEDEARFEIDMLPFEKVTLQSYGYKMLKHTYRHANINHLIKQSILAKRNKGLYIARFDPDDISRTYLWDPQAKRYFSVPFRDMALRPISLRESRARTKEINQRMASTRRANEHLIARAQRTQEATIAEETKKTRTAVNKRMARSRDRGLRLLVAQARHKRRGEAITDGALGQRVEPVLITYQPSPQPDAAVPESSTKPPAKKSSARAVRIQMSKTFLPFMEG